MVIDVSLSSFISSFVTLHSVIDNRCLRPFGVGFGGVCVWREGEVSPFSGGIGG